MGEATFTFRVDDALKAEFSTAAKTRDRSAAQLLRDYMREFVQLQQESSAHDPWFRQQVEIGLASANAGRLIPAQEVEDRFAAKRAATRQRLEVAQ
jgi:predicted transcriptional regulator